MAGVGLCRWQARSGWRQPAGGAGGGGDRLSGPFFTSDQLPEYRTALLHTDGIWHQPARRGRRGRFPHRRRLPHPDLLYAQVVKQREGGRVVAVTSQVVFGDAATVGVRLAASPTSTTINTSFVERENLSLRQHNRRLTRDTNGFTKELPWLEKQLWLALAYYRPSEKEVDSA